MGNFSELTLNGVTMKSVSKFLAAVAGALVATTGVAFAAPAFNVPEPGSMALIGIAIAGLVASRVGKK